MASRDPYLPNIIVIMTDDQGPWALGAAGNREIATPTLDTLAREGTFFENFFCASPVCSPSRASLLTGRMPSAHGVHDHVRGEEFGLPDREPYISDFSTTPEVLAEAGWKCGRAGKWHLGTARQPAPGVRFWYAHRTAAGPYYNAPVWSDGKAVNEPRYITDAITEEACAFIDGAMRDRSRFYLQVNYTAPHSPWVDQHPGQYARIYADCPFRSCPQESPHEWARRDGPAGEAMADPRPSLIGYFAAVTAMDAAVARLLDRLHQHRIRPATLIVFTSDNGFSCGHHGIWGKGNGTWPVNMWENSVRVPAIFNQPERVARGAIRQDLASACDLHPTLLEMAGVAIPGDPLSAGRSLARTLTRGRETARDSVFVFDEYGGTRMVRGKRWKYVKRRQNIDELYDLVNDPDERENRVDDRACSRTVKELDAVLHDWFETHADGELDAYHRPVSGWGQNAPLWKGLPDLETYEQPPHDP
jgi:choline-sulfatase